MKEVAEFLTRYLSNTVEIAAALIIGLALLQVLYRYMHLLVVKSDTTTNEQIRIKFGSAVAVALELLVGADVLATAVAPTWDDIGKLAAIAILRTALNFFLERELRSVEIKNPVQRVNKNE